MSKIYEAVFKNSGEISELISPAITERPKKEAAAIHEPSDDLLLRAVLDDALAPPAPESREPAGAAEAVSAEWQRMAFMEVVRTHPVCVAGTSPLLPFDSTNAVAAEQYRMIRTKLIQHPKKPRMVLISSAGPSDGKSVTAVNVAGALALKNEADVLLVDADLRRSSIHRQLGLESSPGLSDVLTGAATLEQAVIRVAQFPNLYILPAGEAGGNPGELLDSTRWTELANQMRSLFPYIIVDSPPVASLADYDLLQASCDGVVLVVRPDHTKRQFCMRALETVPKDKLVGVIMNCVADWFLARSTPYSYYHHETYGAIPEKDR